MRLATRDDLPALRAIAVATLRQAWPDASIDDSLPGFFEQFVRAPVVVACADDASAFILSERLDQGHWMVRHLMPITMSATMGRQLIVFALRREHQLRPLDPTTECFARLDARSQVERATAQAYQINLQSGIRNVTDAHGTVVAHEIFMTAQAIAARLGVTL